MLLFTIGAEGRRSNTTGRAYALMRNCQGTSVHQLTYSYDGLWQVLACLSLRLYRR